MNPRILLLLFFAFTIAVTVSAQNPGGVTGAKLWLKADGAVVVSGNQVTEWTNQSSGDITTQAGKSASANVVLDPDIFNGRPAIKFDGVSGQYLSGAAGTAFNTLQTIFIVCRRDGSAVTTNDFQGTFSSGGDAINGIGGNGILFFETSSSYLLDGQNPTASNSASAGSSGTPLLLRGIYKNVILTSNSVLAANGAANISPGSTIITPGSNFRIGGRTISSDAVFNGYIAEVIQFPSDISTTAGNIDKVESYLAFKYGITLNEGTSRPYVSAAGATIWSAPAAYQHDVIGVGQDDGSGLTVLSSNSINSGSGDFTGQSGKGNLVLTASSLADQQFLFMGHNGTAATIDNASVPGSISGYSRSSRIWYAEETGFNNDVTLSFDFSGLNVMPGTSETDIKLLVNTTDDMSTATVIDASSVTGDVVTFDAVNLPSNAYFSFAFLNTVLPIKFTGFKVSRSNNYNLLQWTTANETGYDRYEVEHSSDGSSFAVIANLPHRQNVTDYAYQHVTEEPGVHYYRIAGFDKEGVKTYTSVQSVRVSNLQSFRIAPNPAKETLTVQVNAKRAAKVSLKVLNAEGKQVMLNHNSLSAGTQQIQLNTKHLAAGTYVLQVITSDEIITRRFLRIR